MMKKRSNGEGSWGEKTINGITYQRFTKSYYGKTKDFYGKTRAEVKNKVAKYEGQSHLQSTNDIQKMSFEKYCNKYLFEWRTKNITDKTIDYYDMIIRNYITGSKIGTMQLKFINSSEPKAIAAVISDHMQEKAKNLSKSTLDGIHTFFSIVFKYACKNGDCSYNPMVFVDKISEEESGHKKKILKALEYEDFKKLKQEMLRQNTPGFCISGKVGSYVYGICAYAVVFTGYTGFRQGELAALKWKDVDFDKNTITIQKQIVVVKNRDKKDESENNYINKEKDTKSISGERIIPLSDEAKKILILIRERFKNDKPNDYIFSTTDKPISDSRMNRTLKQMCLRADIPKISVHELRHSFASILLNEDDKNLYVVSYLLGHSSTDVTYKKYIHIFQKKTAESMSIFDKIETS